MLVIDEFIEYKTEYGAHESSDFINTLLKTDIQKLVSNKHEVLAATFNYTYYPYGDGWARILGASSGSAPSEKCEMDAKFDFYEITPPSK